jgi:acyl-CoA reductase-like NAD-dependent aldehyde dehydrogenase
MPLWNALTVGVHCTAFNHPLNLIVHQVVPAVATGCPVVVKPALATPLSCVRLVKLLKDAGLPDGWCEVHACGPCTHAKRAQAILRGVRA